MAFVLHVVPDSLGNQAKPFVGSTKDVRGRTEYFQDRGIEHREFLSVGRSDAEALEHLRQADLDGCAAVLFEYETYIESLRFLKEAHPGVLRLVRAHNANFPHMLDNFTGRVRMGDGAKAAEDVHTGLVRFQQDRACAGLADALLAICDWEAVNYWDPLAAPGKVVDVPYFLPRSFVIPETGMQRRNLLVCFMGTGGIMTPLLYDAGRNVIELVERLGDDLPDWEFAITGALKPADVLGRLGRIRPTGLLPSPFPILAEARVVTILSDLGMGFKTKILEAIMAGCWVIVTPDVFRRLPEAVRPWCKAVRSNSLEDFRRTLDECSGPPPAGHPNDRLREAAFAGLDEVLLHRGVGLKS